jgi:hypothetical protein
LAPWGPHEARVTKAVNESAREPKRARVFMLGTVRRESWGLVGPLDRLVGSFGPLGSLASDV